MDSVIAALCPTTDTDGLLQEGDLVPDRALSEGDPDKLNHAAIAGRVAEIVGMSSTPVNIGLFGRWGSGKSSFRELLVRRLPDTVRLVYYDAWKYGGSSLKRNFISHVATELGLSPDDPSNVRYHRGLYESYRSVDLSFGHFLRSQGWSILRAGALVIAAVLALVFLVALIVSAVQGEDFIGAAAGHVMAWGATFALFLGTLVSSLKILDLARVEVETSAPSTDEQFSTMFGEVVRRGRSQSKAARLVFFIDELDRCSRDDVVDTLSAMRTFLDIPDCVFIVVADRDVLEEALHQLPHGVPSDAGTPYYSSASEFLDKIFQYQVALPPLRADRLTGFARDLVSERGGIWKELKDAGLLERVLYAVVPSHVRSPRRVKVLLNRFATSARVAQARGIDWTARAEEIAKLTVLETEFPVLAKLLVVEPRIPAFILEGKLPDTLSADRRLLVAPLIAGVRDRENSSGSDGEVIALDRVLSGDGRSAIARTQRDNLMRYLRRVDRVQNPARDLLYLEWAGAAFGLEPDAGQQIEDLAGEAPELAFDRALDLPEEQRVAAAEFLSAMVEREQGVERANILKALLLLASEMGPGFQPASRSAAEAIRSLMREQELAEDHLLGAFRVSVLARDSALTSRTLQDPRFFSGLDRTIGAASVIDQLVSQDDRALVLEQFKTVASDTPPLLTQPLRSLPGAEARSLVDAVGYKAFRKYFQAMEASHGESEVVTRASEMFSASDLAEVQLHVLWQVLLTNTAGGHQVALDNRELIKTAPDQTRDRLALYAIRVTVPEHWPAWAAYLSDGTYESEADAERARRTFAAILEAYPGDLGARERKAAELAARSCARITSRSAEAVRSELIANLTSALGKRDWWASADILEEQRRLHVLAGLVAEGDHAANDAIEVARRDDILRGVDSRPLTREALRGLRSLSDGLSETHVRTLYSAAKELSNGSNAHPLDPELARTVVDLSCRMTTATAPGELESTVEEAVAALDDGDEDGLSVVGRWLACGPSVPQAVRIARRIHELEPARGAARLRAWLDSRSDAERTEFLLGLWSEGVLGEAWIREVHHSGVDEVRVVDSLVTEAEAAPRSDAREQIVNRLVAFAPREAKAQRRVGDLVVTLFSSGKKVDFKLGLRAVPALGRDHHSKGRIEAALREGADRTNEKLTKSEVEAVVYAGLNPPRKSVKEKAWKWFKDLTS